MIYKTCKERTYVIVLKIYNEKNYEKLQLWKEVRIVSVDDTISCFSHEGLIEELSDQEIKDQLAGEPHLDPSRFVSYPDDLRPSFRLPQRLTSRRSTVFLQSSLCCCQASRERREPGSDYGGLSWLFCCFRRAIKSIRLTLDLVVLIIRAVVVLAVVFGSQ